MFSLRVRFGSLVALLVGALAPLAQEPPKSELTAEPVKTFGSKKLRHGSRIQCLLFAPPGAFPEAPNRSLLVAGGGNDPIRVWDPDSGDRVRTIDFPWTQALAWGQADHKLVAASAFRSLRIVNPRDAKDDIRHENAPAALTAIAVGPNGKPIFAGCQDGQLLLYFPSNRKAVHILGHKGEVNAVATTTVGKLYASGGGDRAIVLWRLTPASDGLEKVKTLAAPGMVRALAFTPDGQTLLSAGDDRAIRMWDVRSGQIKHSLDSHKDTIAALALSADGQTLVSTSYDETAIVWDFAKRAQRRAIPIRFGDADALAVSPDGKRLAVGGGHNVIRLFDNETGKERLFSPGAQAPLVKIAYFPRLGKLLALAATGDIQQWDAKSAAVDKSWTANRAPLVQQDLFLLGAPDESFLLTASSARTSADAWNPATGQRLGSIALPEALSAVAISPSSQRIGLAFRSGLVQIVDWPSREGIVTMKAAGLVQSLAFSPSGRVMATASAGKIQLWDVPSGKLLHHFFAKEETPENHQPAVADLAFSPDGKILAVSGYDAVIRLADWQAGKMLLSCDGHTSAAPSLAFAPDGRTFASASFDKTVRLWETFTGKTVEIFKDHDGPVASVVFAPNGRTIYSASADARALAWDPTVLIVEKSQDVKLDDSKLQSIWNALAAESGNVGQAAVWHLVASPKDSTAYLASHVYLLDPTKVDQLFIDLDADDFMTRDKATQELEKFGRWMEGRLETALQNPPSLEVKRRVERMLGLLVKTDALTLKQERLRMRRVMQTLEQIGDREAVKVLEKLARGAAEPELQREAEMSLKRLQKRSG